ncbi:hypothetical protein E3O45_10340 [Cryobacterium sp. TMS1-20-1]|uniref:hypothetical protein n=1 Tax=Cryobacterium sp. TMS1-20-1 TaxID=1259223 RepID=UPI00106D607A|nr:hypothetical protein [Cryobacterium sp. TMS1-20-1]TFC74580.1 hypothetical protein E3O45_10340 [Cryobacterium sp. TMS1-20-1]
MPDVRRQLLEQNEGFSTTTSYEGKNSSEDRRYTITDGKLHVHASGNTSWADSRYKSDFVADDDQTHRYLYNNLSLLNQDDVIQTKVVRPKRPPESVAAIEQPVTVDQLADPTANASDRRVVVVVAVVVVGVVVVVGTLAYVLGKPAWDNRMKPAIERRRAERAQRKATAACERMRTETRDDAPAEG